MKNQQLPAEEPRLCQTCNIQLLPESAQHVALIILQLILAFVNIKFSLILICIGYAFSRTLWVCPLCKRSNSIETEYQSTNNHIIIRVGDCMMLISKNKFRLVALFLVAFISYLFLQEPKHKPKIPIEKTWKSIVTNCGYESHIENSFRTNFLYSEYSNLDEWVLQGIFLSRDNPGKNGDVFVKIKMNPSQFTDPDMEDFRVFTKKPEVELEKGDQIRVFGRWKGMIHHFMIFSGDKVEKTGRKVDPKSVDTFSKGIRRAGASD